jgi:hypothetical protein
MNYKNKYIKYKNKYINLQKTQHAGAENKLEFNSKTRFIEFNDLAIGNPQNTSDKINVLSMVDKASALYFLYNKLTKNFEVETLGEYKGHFLTMDTTGTDNRLCQILEQNSMPNIQQFEVEENAIYAVDAEGNIFILKVVTGDLLFKKIDIQSFDIYRTTLKNLNINRTTLLNLAFLKKDFYMVKSLIHHYEDVEAEDAIDWDKLLYNAILIENSDIVLYLLEYAEHTKLVNIHLLDILFFAHDLLNKKNKTISYEKMKIIKIIKDYIVIEEKKILDDSIRLKLYFMRDQDTLKTCFWLINQYVNDDLQYPRTIDYQWKFQNMFSYAIPSYNSILKIKDFVKDNQILEVGAGNGLWAGLLKKAGCNIIATDNFSTHGTGLIKYIDVENLSHIEAINTYKDYHVLFLCWPPQIDSMSDEAIQLFKGDKLVYIGGYGNTGLTGSSLFHDILKNQWDLVEKVTIPRWKNVEDELYLYKRKET